MSLFSAKDMKMLSPSDFDGKKIRGINDGMLMVGVSWCGHCQVLKPTWSQFRRFAGKEFPVMALDAEAHPEMVRKLGVAGYPTIFRVQGGRLKQYTGGRSLFDLFSDMCDLNGNHKLCKRKQKS